MTEQTLHALLIVVVASAVTAALRFIPFLVFGRGKQTPPIISYLGRVLPCAIMGMLVVYCMKDVPFFSAPYGAPELLAILFVVIVHKWKHNTLLSVAGGTICYMLLVQMVFV